MKSACDAATNEPLRSICEMNQSPVVFAFLKKGAELRKITPSSGLATKPAMTTCARCPDTAAFGWSTDRTKYMQTRVTEAVMAERVRGLLRDWFTCWCRLQAS